MRADAQRVVVTGMGAVSAFGLGVPALWAGLSEGRCAIAPLRHERAAEMRVRVAAQVPEDYTPEPHFSREVLPQLDRVAQFALLAAGEAIAQSGLRFEPGGSAERTGCIVGTAVGGENTQDEQSRRLYAENAQRLHPLTIIRAMTNAAASQISMRHGLHGPSFVVASACASSNHAIAQAVQLIRAGVMDVALAGGSEASLSYGAMRAWEAMRVLADDTCRPFSANRKGLVLGEGAAMFVLESLEHAQRRGATVLGEIAGVGMSSDAGDIVAPDMAGAASAMRTALADAGMEPAQVDYVNAHGTATLANDINEVRAIAQVFGAHARQVAVSSTKSMHGHALGASGALELVAVLRAMAESRVPPTINMDSLDPQCEGVDHVLGSARAMPVTAALSNSFAFGGLNAVLVLRSA
ncbi:MAG: beta-ketoacyl-[acyl-carrier-protein] synthase family protein [Stenotrophomonas nitritireducens]|uniref:beta-ketoacyl-[acyl-carrier-protein] synthase family protein n=1 Tax=Stenotrophomonas nitritireducens TaxID=83617 RepID=UPI001ACE96A2|nr:beta-ketoacyl-[acyl-carrier-protein] synthase family protein [Stenotrophomonas nitritireducens]MBN8768749.1 beta-ketoacyl-[acyl-carrier-protein] synthase family protein [Stenotrophomonas sp.]MBN8792018.1 beta-ketoacyl-[acyl-carrier-protein] synthase family protein [Stenotrophomonas nitritireducens]